MNKNQQGLSLIEILVTTGVMLFALFAVVSLSIYIMRTNSLNERMVTAIILAQEKTEKLKTTPFSRLTEGVETTVTNGVIYTISWRFTTLSQNLIDIFITVSWKDSNGDHKASIDTRRTKYY